MAIRQDNSFFQRFLRFFFDRGTLQLNIGTAIYFITGLIIFSSGIFKFFRNNPKPELLTSILIAGLFHFYFVVWFLFGYEQSIYPLSLTMTGLGLFLHLRKDYSPFLLGLITITILYLVFMYTSGLASAILFILFLIYFTIYKCRKLIARLSYIAVIIISFGMLFSSFTYRKDIAVGSFADGGLPMRLADITHGTTGLLLNSLPIQYMTWFIYPLLLFSVISILLIRKNILQILFVGAWIIGVIVLSIVSKGYSYYVVEFRLHRSIITIPFLLMAIGFAINRFKFKPVLIRYLYPSLFIFILLTSLYNVFYSLYLKIGSERHRHTELIHSLKQPMPQKVDEGILSFDDDLYAVENFSNNYVSINDSLKYYLPGFTACPNSSCPNPTNKRVYYISHRSESEGHFVKKFSFQNDKLIYITTK